MQDDNIQQLKNSLALTRKGINQHLKQGRKFLDVELVNLERKLILAKIIIGVSTCVTLGGLILAAAFQNWGSFLIPIVFLNIFFFFWFGQIWLTSLQDRVQQAKAKADPKIANQALAFLSLSQALTDMRTLLETPSDAEDYQHRYLNMLVDLMTVSGGYDPKTYNLERKKSNLKIVLKEAYSPSPELFEPEFLKGWLNDFIMLQQKMSGYFGSALPTFCNETKKNPVFFLDCYCAFLQSETPKKVMKFLL